MFLLVILSVAADVEPTPQVQVQQAFGGARQTVISDIVIILVVLVIIMTFGWITALYLSFGKSSPSCQVDLIINKLEEFENKFHLQDLRLKELTGVMVSMTGVISFLSSDNDVINSFDSRRSKEFSDKLSRGIKKKRS